MHVEDVLRKLTGIMIVLSVVSCRCFAENAEVALCVVSDRLVESHVMTSPFLASPSAHQFAGL